MPDHPLLPALPPLGPDTRAWALTNGMAGFEVQARGVAEALDLTLEMKRVHPGVPYSWLAPWGPAAPDDEVRPPWPDLLIAAGRQAIPYARMIKRKSKGHSFVAILQDPKVSPGAFDLVWAPTHDRLTGENVITTLTSPSRITRARLEAEKAQFADSIAPLPRPRIAVLIGGRNKVYDFSIEDADRLGRQLADLARASGSGLLITPSRRTGDAQLAAIATHMRDLPHLIWDGRDPNPYFGYLGAADAVLVTSDSVNMVGEAVATGQPTYVVELPGGSAKFRRFLDGLYAAGAAKPFRGELESFTPQTLNATDAVAAALRDRYEAHRQRMGDLAA